MLLLDRLPIGPNRYRLAQLLDGRLLALDVEKPAAYLLSPIQAESRAYALLDGHIAVRGGSVTVGRGARNTEYALRPVEAGIQVTRLAEPQLTFVAAARAPAPDGIPSHSFALVDSTEREPLLVTDNGLFQLRGDPAPDGTYPQVGGVGVVVKAGRARIANLLASALHP